MVALAATSPVLARGGGGHGGHGGFGGGGFHGVVFRRGYGGYGGYGCGPDIAGGLIVGSLLGGLEYGCYNGYYANSGCYYGY